MTRLPDDGTPGNGTIVTDERELLVKLDRSSTIPLAMQLENALRVAVLSGRLPPGVRLPATRTHAVDLGVSRGVVVEAYEQLVAEGYLIGRAGGGTSVRDGSWAGHSDAGFRDPAFGLLDVRPGAPDLANFPRSQWRASFTHALRQATNAELGYVAPWGLPLLRAELARYLGRARGAVATADSLIVTSGATQALTVLVRTLVRHGHTSLALEDPSNAVQRGVLSSHGIQIVDVPVGDQGIEIDALVRTRARVVLVTPAHQFPTGVLMSPQRRTELLRWAAEVDGLIIEDDYDGELRFDGRVATCLQGEDPERVILVGSASKTLAPGLRLGWVRPPQTFVDAVAETKRDDDFGSDVMTQLTFAHFLHSGRYDKHLRAARRLYRRRRESLVRALRQQLPDWRIWGFAAGQHLSVELPRSMDEATITELARRKGLLVLPMTCMRNAPGPPAITLSYARLTESQLTRVVEILSTIAGSGMHQPAPVVRDMTEPKLTQGPAHTVNAVDYFPTQPRTNASTASKDSPQ